MSDALSNNQMRQSAAAFEMIRKVVPNEKVFDSSAITVAAAVRNLKNPIAVVNNDHHPFGDLFKTVESRSLMAEVQLDAV